MELMIGEKLKKARIDKKLTQEKLAEKLDVSIAFLSRIERGNSHISLKRLSEVCDILGVTEGYILNSNTLKDISFSSPKIPSLNSIQLLIDCVEADYELDDAPDIFTSTIESDQLGLLWNLDKSNYRYSFQKAYRGQRYPLLLLFSKARCSC